MKTISKLSWGVLAVVLIFSYSCGNNNSNSAQSTNDSSKTYKDMIPDKANFQATIDGKQTDLFILKNHNGMQAAITNYGGRLVSLLVPDKNGKMRDVAVGFKNVKDYEQPTDAYFGATIGRFGNRIANGKFKLNGKEYTLFKNNGPNTLHGGKKGFSAVVWDAKQLNDSTLELSYLSKDMEEGFPGNLQVKVTYSLTDKNEFKCEYEAKTDKPTVINLTNHTYFNLNGEGSGTINNHFLYINADKYTPVDSTLIPTGKIEPVEGTPFDFRKPTQIGARINDTSNQQLKFGKGYDHNFVLNKKDHEMSEAASIGGEKSGIVMTVYTEEPGMQFYGGNFMAGQNTFKSGVKDDYRTAFAMETQHFPDSPNQPNFPSTVLEPGQTYHTVTIYSFSVEK